MNRSEREPDGSGHDRGGENPSDSATSTAGLAGMGVQFLAAILLSLFAGRWLDARLGTAPVFLILGVFLGAGASMFAMYRKTFPPSAQPPAAPKAPAP